MIWILRSNGKGEESMFVLKFSVKLIVHELILEHTILGDLGSVSECQASRLTFRFVAKGSDQCQLAHFTAVYYYANRSFQTIAADLLTLAGFCSAAAAELAAYAACFWASVCRSCVLVAS